MRTRDIIVGAMVLLVLGAFVCLRDNFSRPARVTTLAHPRHFAVLAGARAMPPCSFWPAGI
jgi:hypothetical protein